MTRTSSLSACLSESAESPMDGAQIWTAHLESLPAAEFSELNASLDAGERTRAARFHFDRDRRNYIATRGFLRALLGAALGKAASAICFEYGPHGKPALAPTGAQACSLRFNVSHSGDWAMFALVHDRDVGIDLESGSRLERDANDLGELAVRVLSKRELTIWRALPDSATRRAAFLRAWTRKEAYCKATGKGVADELRTIELVLDAATPESALTISVAAADRNPARDWIVYDLPAPEGFAAALAVEESHN